MEKMKTKEMKKVKAGSPSNEIFPTHMSIEGQKSNKHKRKSSFLQWTLLDDFSRFWQSARTTQKKKKEKEKEEEEEEEEEKMKKRKNTKNKKCKKKRRMQKNEINKKS